MHSDNEATVGDYVTLKRGTTYKGALVGEPGPALLGLGSIRPGGGFRLDGFKTYGGDCPPRLMLLPGDLFVSLKGATKDGEMIGSVARVPDAVASGRLTQDTVKLELRTGMEEYSTYLYWVLRSPQYRAYCAGHATGSAVVALSRRDFLAYPVPTPTRERAAVAFLLDALDDRIELNRRMSETLEEMSGSLFRRWFVDGESPPAGAVEPVPAVDWAVLPLDHLADFLNGAACQKYPALDGQPSLPVIKIRELSQGVTNQSDRVTQQIPRKWHVQNGDVLFSWSGTLLVKVWTGGPAALNQHLFKVTSAEYPKWLYLQWVLHHLDEFRSVAADKATTMGHIKRHHLSDARCRVPPPAILNAMTDVMAPLLDRQIACENESSTLGEIRDALLPKLISGELRIPDAERLVGEVT